MSISFNDFWNNSDVQTIWIVTTGIPSGVTLTHDTDTDSEDDFCDLAEFTNEQDWLGDLEGEVIGDQWCWDGDGHANYLTNIVLNVKAQRA
jgi:hypothetical protein